MSMTNSFETDLLELLFNNTTLANIGDTTGIVGSTADGSLYIALTTTTPTDSAAGTAANYTGYARVAVARTAGGWTIAGANASNAALVTFGECTAGSSTVTHFEIYTAITGGDRLFWGALDSSLAISTTANQIPQFAIGDLDVDAD